MCVRTRHALRNYGPTSPKPHSNGLGPHRHARLSYTSPQTHQAKESRLVNKPTKCVPLFPMWDKLKHLKHFFTFTLFLQSPTECRHERRNFWRKIESNASVLVPKGYEPVLGQISIESQNTMKINFYELVFLNVTQGTFIHIGFLNYTTSSIKRIGTNRSCSLLGYS